MEYLELKVIFDAAEPDLAGDLIGSLFDDLGLGGVVVETPDRDSAADWGADAVPVPDHHAVIGYLPVNAELNGRRQRLVEALGHLAGRVPLTWEIRERKMAEEDWAESWKVFFYPVPVGQRLVVKPTWRPYAPQPGQIVIEIDPGMAFGSGTHPTTQLCLGFLEDELKVGDAVLDVGTGSGILLLAAAKLGAGFMAGVDIDAVAVAVAAANLARNGISSDRFQLRQGGIDQAPERAYPLIVANILSEVILPMIPAIAGRLAPAGVFIASGIISGNAPAVTEALTAAGLDLVTQRRQDDWVALAARRSKPV
ncbi:MAG: 50S ribosomal protein L11 methyltransferase [Desulfobacterales bacterium]|jgi:ribosomal protein L11 methyltransferase|nr:50S ribosomal protein L11 methyltransferase [Desulfobacteraceae bacterium]MDD3992650.1 50S ribosomal protein L11 methyltransferase [Desulfobacteraceae bacterium]MDY0311879.1 50S ribosomal protein L11 methyltransferase [Desulfobacterales bacterium]